MSSTNLGRLVKWIDENDQWHTGRVVTQPTCNPYPPFNHPEEVRFGDEGVNDLGGTTLVQESCCGTLTWVRTILLQDWPTRDEWEQKELDLDYA